MGRSAKQRKTGANRGRCTVGQLAQHRRLCQGLHGPLRCTSEHELQHCKKSRKAGNKGPDRGKKTDAPCGGWPGEVKRMMQVGGGVEGPR